MCGNLMGVKAFYVISFGTSFEKMKSTLENPLTTSFRCRQLPKKMLCKIRNRCHSETNCNYNYLSKKAGKIRDRNQRVEDRNRKNVNFIHLKHDYYYYCDLYQSSS